MTTPNCIEGFLVVNKATGLSSMKVLSHVRLLARDSAPGAKSGHAGTLDPLASGVLVIGIGRPATRLLSRVMGTDKRYRTEIDLSGVSPSLDLEFEPSPVEVETPPERGDVEAALANMRGQIMQAPPVFSAIKVGGRRAYHLARKQQLDSLPERRVVVHEITLVAYDWPHATVELRCGKGFYVRSLARDLGSVLGTGGYCRTIQRTAVGPFSIEMARTLQELPDRLQQQDLVSIDDACSAMAACVIPDADTTVRPTRDGESNPDAPCVMRKCDD